MAEIRRLFGPLFRPDPSLNVRHLAMLRKGLELYPEETLKAIFDQQPTKLRLVMGTNFTESQFGVIKSHRMINDRLVRRETEVPPRSAQKALRAYCDGYDVLFNKRGNSYTVRDPAAWPLMQAEEQKWHTFATEFRAARGMGPRPNWALQPLPGLRRVTLALAAAPTLVPVAGPPPAHTPPSTPHRSRAHVQFPTLPSPPTSSPTSSPSPSPASPPPTSSPASSSSGARSSSPIRLDLTHIDDDEEPARASGARSSSPIRIDLTHIDDDEEGARAPPAPKRKLVHLGTIDISDDEDDNDVRPRKRAKFAY
ncbi:hypothetical protein C8F04DRAFT_1274651 [Mycena alexandri]|uniref:Uncharacterized protein n=1 Tax=Mycena alexandri TaxID=1745969 RepID=A0AAD6S5B7_9AGAR|nr:hypothetical protein C8F04DRAFT_1274651 [Mycena alexandri]